jgi:hypothetical protein
MFVVVPNFLAFFVASVYLGGDALNGYVKSSHYFVCAHGACREVSQAIWTYSYWHAVSAVGGIYLIFVELAVLVTTRDIVLDFDRRV